MDSEKYEILTLRKKTRVDELIDSVPKPRNSVPKRGLPLWSTLPLGAKLPVLGGPKRELVFTRDKIGKKLWQNPQQNEFILYDPNCLDVSYHYDSLHDENLRRFFSNKVNRKRMFELGLITKEGDAICSLKDYNEYRRYLKRVHQDAINVERVKMEEQDAEWFLLMKAKENEERDLQSYARKRVRKAKMRHVHERMAAEAEAKAAALIQSQEKHAFRLMMIQRRKEEDLNRRMQKAIAFQMKIEQRNRQAQDIERKRKIRALKKWHDNEVSRRKRMTREKSQKVMDKERKEYHHLHEKIECQKERLKRQKQLLDNYQEEMAIKAELRSKDVEYKRLKMEDRIMKDKAERVRMVSEHTWSIKGMVKALCKAWEDKLRFRSPEEVKEEKKLIEKTIQLQMAEYKHKSEGKEVLAILQGAKRKLDKLFGVPECVSEAVDTILNNVIIGYVRNKVDKIITDTVNQAEQFKKQHEEIVREHQRKKMAAMRPQHQVGGPATESESPPTEKEKEKEKALVTHRTSIRATVEVIRTPVTALSTMKTRSATRSLMSTKTRSQMRTGASAMSSSSLGGRPQRLVSFGSIVTIEKLKEESGAVPLPASNGKEDSAKTEDLTKMRRTKDRPPTPVPSLTQLVEAAFNDPMAMDDLREWDVEKKCLDRQLADFSKKLLMVVLKKADMKVEKKRKQIYRQLSNLYLDKEIVIDRITDAIMYLEDANLMELSEVDHISDVLAKEVIVNRAGYVFQTTFPSPAAAPVTPPSSEKTNNNKKRVLVG